MSFLFRLAGGKQRAGEPSSQPLWLAHAFGATTSSSAGPLVTVEKSMGLAAVWACVAIRSDQVGALPLEVHQRETRKDGGTRLTLIDDERDPTVWLLREEPNPEMTAFELWAMVEQHLATWGNAFLGKQKLGNRVVALWPMEPHRVSVGRERGTKYFDWRRDDGSLHRYTTADVIHIRGRSLDGGLTGVSPITLHRNTVGLGLALDEFGGAIMRNRAVPQGVLAVKGRITDPAVKTRLRREWKSKLSAEAGRQGEIAVLDEDAEFKPITMPLGDAQYIEQRKGSVQDIARIMGVPPEMIAGESGGSMTYSNVEAQGIHFLKYFLRGSLARIAQAVSRDRDLFPPDQRRLASFNVDEIVRGDLFTRFRAYRLALGQNTPFMTVEEVRAHEPGLDGPFEPSAAPSAAPPTDQE